MHDKRVACFGVVLLLVLAVGFLPHAAFASEAHLAHMRDTKAVTSNTNVYPADTTIADTAVREVKVHSRFGAGRPFTDIGVHKPVASVDDVTKFPAVSIHQSLKDQVAGLYVQESTGEPGSVQQVFLRGASMPLFSMREVYQSQPLIVLDGIPLVGEHPFAYDIQQYDYNRIGPATNLLANVDMANIASVQVYKDLAAAAIYGPMAANGAIVLTTKQPEYTRRINFNSYFGVAARPSVTTINGDYENLFRRQFYDRYTSAGRYSDDDTYPIYLSDSLNNAYYGPSNWTDSYYRNALVHSVNADISGGTQRANFRFSMGTMKNSGVADETGISRYSTMFSINMRPLTWLQFSAMVNGNRLDRDRNRNLRDRFAQMSYIPDLQAPLSPNNDVYSQYLRQFDNSFDKNHTNIVEGHAKLLFDFDRFSITSRFAVDYNEGVRDLFYPRTLLEQNSYASNYYGFNQRLIFDNHITYDLPTSGAHKLFIEGGNVFQWDTYKYDYAYAYKGVNDFIKINLLESDPKAGNYLHPTAFPRELVFKFLDRTAHNLVSFYGRASYNYDDKYSLSLLLRSDASSNAQPTNRWLFTPVVSAGWNVKNDLLAENVSITELNFRASAGRMGRLNVFDNFSQGPAYTAQVGYTGNLITPGYNGFGVLTRPYDFGWTGYGIPWAYTDQLNVGADLGFWGGRAHANLDWYIKADKNQLLGIPSYAEYGYRQSYLHGMQVNNTGVELGLSVDMMPKQQNRFGWTTSLQLGVNQNKLVALPGGLDEIVIGDRLLRVGESIDRYWMLANDGIFLADSEVPQVNGTTRSYNGIELKAGDPNWRDLNGDNVIDNEDKVLMGNMLPRVVGGFSNDFTYGRWSANLTFYFNLGRHVVNQNMANRFNFINREGVPNMESVKEVTFWEKHGDYGQYPLYNPWSSVIPYRTDQDLFLENASFLKLRTFSLGYDLGDLLTQRGAKLNKFHVYVTGHNLFTLTSYSGYDPELVNYTGYDTGYGMPIPRTFTLGIQVGL